MTWLTLRSDSSVIARSTTASPGVELRGHRPRRHDEQPLVVRLEPERHRQRHRVGEPAHHDDRPQHDGHGPSPRRQRGDDDADRPATSGEPDGRSAERRGSRSSADINRSGVVEVCSALNDEVQRDGRVLVLVVRRRCGKSTRAHRLSVLRTPLGSIRSPGLLARAGCCRRAARRGWSASWSTAAGGVLMVGLTACRPGQVARARRRPRTSAAARMSLRFAGPPVAVARRGSPK